MPVTTYTTIDGEIVSQDVNGTVHDLLPDPLGHTVGLIGSAQGIEFEYTYWPYEEIGSIDDVATALRYVGTLGYYSDDYGSPRVYVRARHYRGPYGRWLTVDPIWPWEPAYGYVRSSPVTSLDSSGLHPQPGLGGVVGANYRACAALFRLKDAAFRGRVQTCMDKVASAIGHACRRLTDANVQCYARVCQSGKWKIIVDDPSICQEDITTCGFTRNWDPGGTSGECETFVCLNRGPADPGGDISLDYLTWVLLHEINHCCLRDDEPKPHSEFNQCNDIIACCILNSLPDKDPRAWEKCKRKKK